MGARPAFVAGACCLLGAALILGGCGGNGTTTLAPGTKKTTVLMMRHCLRSMPEKGIYDVQGLDYFSNYSQTPWAPFLNKGKPVPDFYCLDRGEKIVEEQGEWLKKNGNLPSPIIAIADTCQRDNVTAHAFLRGLGVDANSDTFSTNRLPFADGKDKTLTPLCKTLTASELFAAISAQRNMTPPPSNYGSLVDQIYKYSGKGAAGDWTKTSCKLEADPKVHWWAPQIGGCNVAGEFAERFLMEWGGGMTPGWGKLGQLNETIPKLLEAHTWYLKTSLFVPSVQKSQAASIAGAILETLEAGAQGTTNFVGHDTQIGGLSAALGLSWDPSPYAESATVPGSMLRFDLDSGSDIVTMSYGFPEDYGKGGDMKFVPASFRGMEAGKVSIKTLRDIVTKGTDTSCRAYKQGAAAQRELVV